MSNRDRTSESEMITVSPRLQITLPVAVARALKIRPGDKLAFSISDDSPSSITGRLIRQRQRRNRKEVA